MVSSRLEAGAVGALAAHANDHLERSPQSPGPGSAHIGSVARHCCDLRGARGLAREHFCSCTNGGTSFFSTTQGSNQRAS